MADRPPPVKKVPLHLQSAQNRLLIKGGRVVNEDRIFDADIYIEDGVIRQIGQNLITPGGARVIEVNGKYVMPGGIDTMTRLQQPADAAGAGGAASADDFYSGTRAALAGGTTTVLNLAAPRPGEPLVAAFDRWRELADEKVCCDYGLHVAITSWTDKTAAEISQLCSERGVNSFKMSMADVHQLSDADLLKVFTHCKKIGAIAQIHAENGDAVREMTSRLLSAGVTGPEGLALSRPEAVEAEAVRRACMLAAQVGSPLHLPHLSSPAAVDEVSAARRRGHIVYGAVTAAALATDGTHYWNRCWRHAAAHVTVPPLRPEPATPDRLVDLLASNDLHCSASDHCTFTSEQRAVGRDDFTKIPQGIGGVEERMAIVWEKVVAQGKMDPMRFVAVTSTNAAKLFNLYPKKGVVAVGSDADLVVWDGETSRVISASTHHQRCDFSVFEGQTVRGVAEWVVSRGRVCVEEGQVRAVQAAGRFLPMAGFAPTVYLRVQQRDKARAPRSVDRSSAATDGGPGAPPSVAPKEPPSPETETDGTVPPQPPSPAAGDGGHHPSSPDTPDSGDIMGSRVPKRTAVKVHAPPGGRSAGSFW
ncbi:dihydropyrimidinase-like [Amphibalanus amphitrite]|nr:dihydropyrimidinase-like [Amphibalanus amphitrite]